MFRFTFITSFAHYEIWLRPWDGSGFFTCIIDFKQSMYREWIQGIRKRPTYRFEDLFWRGGISEDLKSILIPSATVHQTPLPIFKLSLQVP